MSGHPPFPFAATEVLVEETGSTNDLAREIIERGGVALPLLVFARRQTRGRGQGTNLWWSDAGSLTFTIGIDARSAGLLPRHEPLLSLATAIAVIEVIDRHIPSTRLLGIRWPNDIEVDGRKLAGILPERLEDHGRVVLLIGVGLNVQTRLDGAPAEVRKLAASMIEFASDLEIVEVLRSILQRLELVLQRLSQDDPSLAERWAEADCLVGQPIKVKVLEQVKTGIAQGIAANGGLRLATEAGVETLFGGRVLRENL